jgi:hypothetical protein
VRLIPPAAKRQHRASRNRAAGNGLLGDAAVAAALDRVLDTVESLRQETFQSEAVRAVPVRAVQVEAAAEVTRRSYHRRRVALPVLIVRLRYSSRAPYRQIREGVSWGFVIMIAVIAIIWAVITHMS